MNQVRVVCGIIFSENNFLIARRKEGKSLSGFWEFPGGKIEQGENEEESLTRELHEEFGMEIKITERIGENSHDYPELSITLIAYKCEFIQATFELTDHDRIAWVKKNDLHTYKMAPADIPLIDLI